MTRRALPWILAVCAAAVPTGCGATPSYAGISREDPAEGVWLTAGGIRQETDRHGRVYSLQFDAPDLRFTSGGGQEAGSLVLRDVTGAPRLLVRRDGSRLLVDLGDGRELTWYPRYVYVDGEGYRVPHGDAAEATVGYGSPAGNGVLRRGGGVALGRAWFGATDDGDLFVALREGRVTLRDAVPLGGLAFWILDDEVPTAEFDLVGGTSARLDGDRVVVGERVLVAGESL